METLEAAQSTGLPVWVGLTCEPDEKTVMTLRNGEMLSDALAAISDKQVDLVNIMHTEIEHIDACLEVLQANWSGLTGVYAHSGKFTDNKMIFESTISPDDYCTASKRWINSGAQLIGGCCGVGPGHIQALSQALHGS
jgi:S-methylmethionine-dependent homocysteine/selenocysteine methylase